MENLSYSKLTIVRLYESGLSSIEIAKIFGRTQETIRYHLKDSGISMRSARKYMVTENAFDTIDTEEKAYWLGFIAADGNIHRNTLSVCLKATDKQHLEKLRDFLSPKSKLDYRPSNKSWRLRVHSTHLCQSLLGLGITPRKSLTLQYPSLPDTLQRHFLRGHFDGDGWFTHRKSRNVYEAGLVSGSLPFVSKCLHHIGFGNLTSVARKNAHKLMFYSKGDISKLIELLYRNSFVSLNRKRMLAYQVLLWASGEISPIT